MKKLLALLLALALCLTLCACGGEKPSAEPEKSGTSGGVIAKPGETAPTEAPTQAPTEAPTQAPTEKPAKLTPEKPAETPDAGKDKPEETPAPTQAPAPAKIEVTDLCAVSGILTEDGGYSSNYSFTLPEVSGPDTPYLKSLNEEMQALYDDYVVSSLDFMEEYNYLNRYCMAYYYGVRDGVHSILVTCDSDWGMDEYWCFNFDDDGNEVDNKTVLKAVGLKPKEFVAIARDYFVDVTDLSEYGMDAEGWKELQDKTVAEENCNAEMPMVILPNGDLCFIGTIYTIAGAGEYDYALEIDDDREVSDADVGRSMLTLLLGTFELIEEAPEDEDAWNPSTLLDLFMVGDTLTMEVTAFEPEEGSVYYYFAADIFPEDPAALLRADGDGVRVRVLPHCPDVMGGSYYGEPGIYTLYASRYGIAFVDYEGGVPVSGSGEDVYAVTAYRGDLGLDDPIPEFFTNAFDYETVENYGIAGIWSGSYRDENYDTHNITLELTSWGHLKLRDCVGAQIPRILEGQYYIAGENDDLGAPKGSVVFGLVARNGYKMPCIGWCWLFVDDDGSLMIIEEYEDNDTHLTKIAPERGAVLWHAPSVRYTSESGVCALEDGERIHVDIAADGTPEEIGCSIVWNDNQSVIESFVFYLEGEEYTLDDVNLYDADIYLMVPDMSGAVYFYLDGQSDNDYRYTTIVGVGPDDVWYAGDYFGGFAEEPTDVNAFRLRNRLSLLGSVSAERLYRLGMNGLPEAIEPFYTVSGSSKLTAKMDIDCWSVNAIGELSDSVTLPAGEKVALVRSDDASFADLQTKNGDVYRVWVADGSPHTIGGVDIEDCFDGILFAG